MIASSAAATTPPHTSAPSALEEAHHNAAISPQGQRHLRNTQILEASLHVSIQAGNDSLTLLYRTAVDAINTELEPTLGSQAMQSAMDQDNSPEGTAGRIVGLSTAMFSAYAARYPDKDLAEVAQNFVHVIRGGFEQGYQEAQDILNRLGVLGTGSPIAAGIAQTHALVQQGFDDWLSQQLRTLRGEAAASATPEISTPAANAAAG